MCSNGRAALCVLAIQKAVLLGLGHRYLNCFFLGAFQQSAGLITCKNYEVIEWRNLERERGKDVFVKTM